MLSFTRLVCSVAVVGLNLTGPVTVAEPESCTGLIAARDTLFSRAGFRQGEVSLTFVAMPSF